MSGRSLAMVQPSTTFRATRSCGSLRSTISAVRRPLARAHRAARPSCSLPFGARSRQHASEKFEAELLANRSRAGGRKRLVLSLAAAAVFTATASAVTLSQLGGTANRPPAPVRSSRLAATTGLTLAPTKFFNAAANAIANEDRQLTRRVKSPVRHHRRVASVRKRSARHHMVTHATVAPAPRRRRRVPPPRTAARARRLRQALSPRPARPLDSSTSHQSQPAFGQNGSLGPGRGAPGTQ